MRYKKIYNILLINIVSIVLFPAYIVAMEQKKIEPNRKEHISEILKNIDLEQEKMIDTIFQSFRITSYHEIIGFEKDGTPLQVLSPSYNLYKNDDLENNLEQTNLNLNKKIEDEERNIRSLFANLSEEEKEKIRNKLERTKCIQTHMQKQIEILENEEGPTELEEQLFKTTDLIEQYNIQDNIQSQNQEGEEEETIYKKLLKKFEDKINEHNYSCKYCDENADLENRCSLCQQQEKSKAARKEGIEKMRNAIIPEPPDIKGYEIYLRTWRAKSYPNNDGNNNHPTWWPSIAKATTCAACLVIVALLAKKYFA